MLWKTSRREFMFGAGCAMAVSEPLLALPRAQSRPGRGTIAYVGTYSSPGGGSGQGIHIFDVNPATGSLSPREVYPDNSNPTWLAFNAERTRMYAAKRKRGISR